MQGFFHPFAPVDANWYLLHWSLLHHVLLWVNWLVWRDVVLGRLSIVLPDHSVEIAISLEKILIFPCLCWKNTLPSSGSTILSLNFLYDEFVNRWLLSLHLLRTKVVSSLVARMASIYISLTQGSYANHREQISDHIAFDLKIQGTISVHRWGQIHLHQPWLKVRVNQNIETENLEASINVWYIVGKRCKKGIFHWKQRLHNHIIDSFKKLSCLGFTNVEGKKVLQRSQTPFAAKVLFMIAGNKICIFLIHTVIGKMLKSFVFAVVGTSIVLLCGEPG